MTLTIQIEDTARPHEDHDRISCILQAIAKEIDDGYTEGYGVHPTLRYRYHLNDGSKPF